MTLKIKLAKTVGIACFLPYQIEWLEDKSQVKIWEKSRRIGATYCQAYEDVLDALTLKIRNKPCDVWFSSSDKTAAKEYILYCIYWAELFNVAFKDRGEIVIDKDKDVRAYCIQFKNGARINALSSNPTQFRSKGGKVVLDEFAHHKDQQALWTAACASALAWGFPVRILSTHKGAGSKFNSFIEKIKKGKLSWGHHKTTIADAVDMGLADKVCNRKLTEHEREAWLQDLRENSADEVTWLQEFMCDPLDEASSFLNYNLISTCHKEDCLMPLDNLKGDLYVGFDVARHKHLSVISVLEKLGDVCYLRHIDIFQDIKFSIQEDILWSILQRPNVRKCLIDSTGIGNQLSERAQDRFGKYKVEQVNFSAAVKSELAHLLYTGFEDKLIRIPNIVELNTDLHSIKKFVTEANNIRFDADASETDGHGDRFWSVALAYNGSITTKGSTGEVKSSISRKNDGPNYQFKLDASEALLRRSMF